MKAFLLKVDSALYIQWADAAKGSGLNVSEWIRAQCNKGLNGAEDRPIESVPRVAKLSVAERRTGVVSRASRTPERAAKKAEAEGIKLCRHNLSECTICG
jgi:hypothetical protein